MRVRVDSVGCRLNIGEADHLARALAARGHRIVGPGDATDLMIFNSCAVTHVAARKSRKLIRHWKRANPGASIVVTGCYAELAAAEVRALGVDMVIGNADKDEIPQLLESAGVLGTATAIPDPDASPLQPDAVAAGLIDAGVGAAGRTRAFVKVQDGCDHRCTFCVVTVARGDSRSRLVDEIVAEIRGLVDLGYREAVLSGVHLGSYGRDRGQRHGLSELVGAVLAKTSISRLRLSSLEPWDLGPELLDLWASHPRLLPHLHLPLQSGCDATLKRMARRTDQKSFARIVDGARAAIDDLAVTTDVIVGFPGEDDAEFAESLGFVGSLAFAKLHVFRYSARPETAAAAMPAQVEAAVAQRRSRSMHDLGAELEARFRRRHLGRTMPVLWETAEPRPETRRWSGLTENYLRVVTDASDGVDLANRVTPTLLETEIPGAMIGRLAATAGPAGGAVQPSRRR